MGDNRLREDTLKAKCTYKYILTGINKEEDLMFFVLEARRPVGGYWLPKMRKCFSIIKSIKEKYEDVTKGTMKKI